MIARVFPRLTKATPTDAMAFVGEPPLLLAAPIAEVQVSCAFTWDKPEAERLADRWRFIYPDAKVQVGGAAYGDPGGDFTPGLFLAPGYVMTSRGCPNRCERCLVPEREGPLRTLPITEGWDVLDNNLLACPRPHLEAVFAMLARQSHRPRFTGGLEAGRLTRDIAAAMMALKPEVMFFAYDRPEERPAVGGAFALLYELTGWSAGTFRHRVSCYVLCGYEGDTIAAAEERIHWVMSCGARAYPMYWRDDDYAGRPAEWHDLIGGTMTFGGGR